MSSKLEALASYVPGLIVRRFAADPTPLTEPSGERFPAAVLFADIKGFTSLAERFAQHGPAGAEELTKILNAYFGQLIDLVTALGGDVIKFAGDAALALWPATEEDPSMDSGQALATTARRAAQCSLAVQMMLHNYEAADGVHLSMRMGIGAGEILAASVGGMLGRWEFLIAGEPLVQMGAANKYAQPGDVVLSPQAWQLIQDECIGEPLPEGKGIRLEDIRTPLPIRPPASPKLVPGMEEALRGYIPGAILARLDAGQTGWLAELRHVTVMFLNVRGLDFDAPDAIERMQTVMHALQKILYRYEGSVNQFMVDDKGTTLLAAFGLPPLTHEDDPARAAQAAIEMQAELRRLELHSAIGITSGRVFCGQRGNERRREYAMIGDIVNLSARLMVAAPDSILCDAATYQVAQARLAFETLTPITVKGKVRPVAVYRPLLISDSGLRISDRSKSALDDPKSKMIGRAEEQAILAEGLQALLRGDEGSAADVLRPIIIEGEAGIGKSRLVDHLLSQARVPNVNSLIGAGDAIEKSTPYLAWRPVFRQLFDLDQSTDPETRRAHVLARLQSDPDLLRLAPLLNAILPLDLPENEITSQMDGQVRADNTRTLLLQLLQAAAGQAPTLLILEDAHWMDSVSWQLASLVSQSVQPLFFVIVTRPLDKSRAQEYSQALSGAVQTRWLRLEALPPEDTLALVCQRLSVRTLPEPVANLIREKAQGNPFFSEELAYALRDSGLIVIADGECQVAPGAGDFDSLTLPDTVQGIITSRIDRLAPSQQLALKVASVIGRAFAFRILRDIYPVETDKAHLADYLTTLQQLDLTPLDTPAPELSYTFKHIITQEVAYNLMLFSQRQQLHRAVAEWYERTHTGDLSPFYPLLGHHWSKAQVPSKAIDYLEKAGEQALHSYANQEAVNFFAQALELDKETRKQVDKETVSVSQIRRACWERQLGEAYLGLGQLAESREHLEKALALLGQAVPTTSQRWVISLAEQALLQALHRAWPARFSGHGRPTPRQEEEDTGIAMEAARAYWLLGQVYFYANERMPNINANLRSLNLAETAGPSPVLVRSYANVSIAAGLIPLHLLAKIYSRRAREIARSLDHLPSLAWVLLITAVYDTGTGQWEKARCALKEAIEISDHLGDRRRWEQGLNTLAMVTYFQGKFTHSARLFADLYTSARQRGDAQYRAYGLLGQVRCLLSLGQVEATATSLEEVKTLLDENLGRVEEIYAYGLVALAHLRQSEYELAHQAAETAAQLIAQSQPISYTLLHAYAAVAEVYLSLWEIADPSASLPSTRLGTGRTSFGLASLKSEARRACQALHRFAKVFPIGQPGDWLHQGLHEWLSGRPYRAREAWRKALAAAERLGMPYEQGLAHYELGRHASGPERQDHLARAGEIFTRLGAAHDLALVQKAL